MRYDTQDARDATLKYFDGGDILATDVFITKYALTDCNSNLLEKTPDDMHRRLAKEFYRIENKFQRGLSEQEIYDLFYRFKRVIPQGSPMSAIGNDNQIQSLSNCFVVESPQDSYGGICKADEELAQIMKRRGGVGIDVSPIRPRGTITKNAARTSDGVSLFMERYSNTCREVAQDGRRGAEMITISVHHPDILSFIKIKLDKTKVTGANISVRISDEFMNAVINNTTYEQRWPVASTHPTIRKQVDARSIWNEIISAAHKCAEPGTLFWDTILNNTPADVYPKFRSVSTNPCSELPLPPYDSCRLMLVRLLPCVIDPFTPNARFDFDLLEKDSYLAQRLMDDLVELELEAISKILQKIESDLEDFDVKSRELSLWIKIKNMCETGRRTGLGATGLGDVFAMLGLAYGSDESIALTDKIYKTIAISAWRSSIDLAEERGAFPDYDPTLESNHAFINKMLDAVGDEYKAKHAKFGRRNIAITMSSPAGSTSIVGQCTNSIEPLYLMSYTRRRKLTNEDGDIAADFVDDSGDKWKEYHVFHPVIEQWKKITGVQDVTLSPYYGSLAADIDPVASVKIQAAAQNWICHGISKTVNLPSTATVADVEKIYFEAWKRKCKGITVYVDGSRAGVLLANNDKRTKTLNCDIHRVNVKGEPFLILIGLVGNKPYEIFAGLMNKINFPKNCSKGTLTKRKRVNGRATYDLSVHSDVDNAVVETFSDIVSLFENPIYGAMTRALSMILRNNCSIVELIEQLKKDRYSDISSFSSGISRVLKSYVADGTKTNEECPECKEKSLAFQAGCIICQNCAYNKC